MSTVLAYRTLIDEEGVAWEVWEAHPLLTERRMLKERRSARRAAPDRRRAVPSDERLHAALRAGWLVLRSQEGRRRRFPIPLDWDTMSEEELRLVLRHARSTGPQPRAISR